MPPSKGCFYLFAAGSESRRPRLRPSFRLGESSLRAGVLSEPEASSERGASAPEGGPLGFESKRLARREQRGIISNGVNLSAEFNATTGFS